MRSSDLVGNGWRGDVHPGPDHIGDRATQRLDGADGDGAAAHHLPMGSRGNRLTLGWHWSRTSDQNAVVATDPPREPIFAFIWGSRVGAALHRHGKSTVRYSPAPMLRRKSPVPTVAANEVPAQLEAGALLIDVRELKEWNEGRIPQAVFRPMSEINDWYEDLPRDQTIVVYCQSGNRSDNVARALRDQVGLEDVYNMTGGIIAWARGGFDLDQTDSAPES